MHIIFSAILLCLKFKCAACLEVNKFLNVLFAWLNVKGPYFWEFPADLVTFTEEILNGKLPFLCSDYFFFKTFFNPPLLLVHPSPPPPLSLLSFLFCESNSWAICSKKYLSSKNVISKASLKSIEINIHV